MIYSAVLALGVHHSDSIVLWIILHLKGFPSDSVGKESTFSALDADVGSIPGLGRSPGGGPDNPLQNSCLENLMDRGAWQAIVHSVAKSQT